MKLRNITPKAQMCFIGACPALYESDRGTIIVIGHKLDSASVAKLLPGKVSTNEAAIEVPKNLFIEIRNKRIR